MKKQEDVKGLGREELREREFQYREELFNLRFQKETGQLENTGRIKESRRMLARVKTALKENEHQQQY